MEDTSCDVNHLDADVLLPPRKRLLAGLKKQNLDIGEGSSSLSPASCSLSLPSSVFEARLNNLLSAHANNCLTPEEISEASELAAATAADIAKAARVSAEEKAAIAAKKVASAKSALDLVASFSEEGISDEKYLKRNKFKKQVPVHSLYRGRPRKLMNYKTDEDIARKMHRVINSSPRILKNQTSSDPNGNGKKRRDYTIPHGSLEDGLVNGGMVSEVSQIGCNGHAKCGELDTDDYIQGIKVQDEDETAYKKSRESKLQIDKERVPDEKHMMGKKRGRVKLKKLPLSICTSKDRGNLKDEAGDRSLPLNVSALSSENESGDMGLLLMDSSVDGTKKAVEATAMPFWRCQEFKTPACFKQNKVSQS